MAYAPKHAAPKNRLVRRIMARMSRNPFIAGTLALAVLASIILPLTAFRVHLDHYAGSYGVSIGTNTAYCSVEVWHPSATCEHAG